MYYNFEVNSSLSVPGNHFLSSQIIHDGFWGCFPLAFAFLHNLVLPRSVPFVLTSVLLEAVSLSILCSLPVSCHFGVGIKYSQTAPQCTEPPWWVYWGTLNWGPPFFYLRQFRLLGNSLPVSCPKGAGFPGAKYRNKVKLLLSSPVSQDTVNHHTRRPRVQTLFCPLQE